MTARVIACILFLSVLIACSSVKKNTQVEIKSGNTKVLFAGDLMLDWGIKDIISARGPEYSVVNLKKFFSESDYRFCNLECPVSGTGEVHPDKKYVFLGNPEHLKLLTYAGINGVSLANNHANDYGKSALLDTILNLEKNGIRSTGAGKDLWTSRLPVSVIKGNIKIAVSAYTIIAYDDSFAGTDNPGVAKADIDVISADIRQFKEYHDFFIVSVHWGDEYSEYPNQEQRELAHQMIDSGADAVIGHHPHIYQGIEIYKNKPIFYSLGNFIFGSINEDIKENILVQISFTKKSIEYFRIYAINSNKSDNPFQYNLLNEDASKQIWENLFKISAHLGEFKDKARIDKNSVIFNF